MKGEITWAADELGPAKVVFLRLRVSLDPAAGVPGVISKGGGSLSHEPVTAVVVIDNVALGPAIGGTRMRQDVTASEVARLARAMTMKNALAGLPHGGGKSGIAASPGMEPAAHEQLMRAFARAIEQLADYIPGPDMGTTETSMAYVHDETGRAVGLPAVLGGVPLNEYGATGFGLAVCADVLHDAGLIQLGGARTIVQGFGAVGSHAALALAERGTILVAASDIGGAVWNPEGLDIPALIAHTKSGLPVGEFPGGNAVPRDDILGFDCDILIPAAQPDVVTAENAGKISARVILEGANIPITRDAEAELVGRGILCVPDVIANAGGVICAAAEYRGAGHIEAFAEITEKITDTTTELLDRAHKSGHSLRAAADQMARERVEAAIALRRKY
jgi:glutamate dehydrogenase/leucine dehydrogenase